MAELGLEALALVLVVLEIFELGFVILAIIVMGLVVLEIEELLALRIVQIFMKLLFYSHYLIPKQ